MPFYLTDAVLRYDNGTWTHKGSATFTKKWKGNLIIPKGLKYRGYQIRTCHLDKFEVWI